MLPTDPARLTDEDAFDMAMMLVKAGPDRALHPAKWVAGWAEAQIAGHNDQEIDGLL